MDGIITVAEVKSGEVDIIDLLKLNALLDMKAALEQRAMKEANNA